MVFGNLSTGIEIFAASDTSNINIPLLGSIRKVRETTYRGYPIIITINDTRGSSANPSGDGISFTEGLDEGMFISGEAWLGIRTDTTGAGYSVLQEIYKITPSEYNWDTINEALNDELNKAQGYIDANFEDDYVPPTNTTGGGGYDSGTWRPDLQYTLVDTNTGKSADEYYAYGLYKVEFENTDGTFGEPEWRIYSEGPIELLDDEGNERFENLSYTFVTDAPKVVLQDDDSDPFEGSAPYVATYTTEEDGKQALSDSVPLMGCRDKTASNYDYAATMDDGSCNYDEESKSNMMMILVNGGIAAAAVMM